MSLLLLVAGLAQAGTVSLSPGDDIVAKTQGLGAGDEIIFTAGTYDIESTIRWEGLGTEDAPIVFRGREGDDVVIRVADGGYVAELNNSTWVEIRNLTFQGDDAWMDFGYGGLRVSESSNVTIEDVTIRNVWSTGLNISGNGTGFTVQRNHIYSTGDGSGIYVGCGDASCWLQDSLIAENHIHDLGGDYVTGISLQNGSQNVEIRDNVIYRVATADGGDGIYAGTTEFGPPNHIVGNIVWQVTDDGIYLEGPARVHNNVVFDAGDIGLVARNNDRDGLMDLVISFNTVVNTGGDGVRLEDWFHREGMVFANNVVANPTGYGLDYDSDWLEGEETTNYISTNHVTGLVEGFDQSLFPDWVVPGGGYADFVDVENWDFYPASTSDLVNGGDPAGEAYVPATDFNGVPREGDAPDVGAYEWDGEGNPGWTVQEGFKELGYTQGGGRGEVSSGCCGGSKGADEPSEALFLLPLGLGWMLRRRRRD